MTHGQVLMGHQVRPRNIIVGQRVRPTKVERAKELRRDLTTQEQVLWQALRRNQLIGLHFRRQQVIAGFIVDFYCHAAGLVVEVDGPIHETSTEHDSARDELLTSHGLRILRFTNDEVRQDLAKVLALIRETAGLALRPPT